MYIDLPKIDSFIFVSLSIRLLLRAISGAICVPLVCGSKSGGRNDFVAAEWRFGSAIRDSVGWCDCGNGRVAWAWMVGGSQLLLSEEELPDRSLDDVLDDVGSLDVLLYALLMKLVKFDPRAPFV
jgi:hypothetical protein